MSNPAIHWIIRALKDLVAYAVWTPLCMERAEESHWNKHKNQHGCKNVLP